jgi:hypothetical protein
MQKIFRVRKKSQIKTENIQGNGENILVMKIITEIIQVNSENIQGLSEIIIC